MAPCADRGGFALIAGMFYVVAEAVDAPPMSYRWFVYDYDNPTKPIQQADHSYTSRAAAIEAGWAVVERLEDNLR
jgi:hypothetical protein